MTGTGADIVGAGVDTGTWSASTVLLETEKEPAVTWLFELLLLLLELLLLLLLEVPFEEIGMRTGTWGDPSSASFLLLSASSSSSSLSLSRRG